MALLEKQLYVKKSTLPDSGKGLFTKRFIPKGTRIVEYKGRRTTWKEAKDHIENGYLFYITRDKVIDALPYKKALGRFANDARGLTRVKGITNNAEYIIDGDKVFIDAKKDIPAYSEILVGYGGDYWEKIRYNINLEKKKRKKEKAKRKHR